MAPIINTLIVAVFSTCCVGWDWIHVKRLHPVCAFRTHLILRCWTFYQALFIIFSVSVLTLGILEFAIGQAPHWLEWILRILVDVNIIAAFTTRQDGNGLPSPDRKVNEVSNALNHYKDLLQKLASDSENKYVSISLIYFSQFLTAMRLLTTTVTVAASTRVAEYVSYVSRNLRFTIDDYDQDWGLKIQRRRRKATNLARRIQSALAARGLSFGDLPLASQTLVESALQAHSSVAAAEELCALLVVVSPANVIHGVHEQRALKRRVRLLPDEPTRCSVKAQAKRHADWAVKREGVIIDETSFGIAVLIRGNAKRYPPDLEVIVERSSYRRPKRGRIAGCDDWHEENAWVGWRLGIWWTDD